MPEKSERSFDIIVWGATGFTGKLVVEYLASHYNNGKPKLKWAMAGRNESKLADCRAEISKRVNVKENSMKILTANIRDNESMDQLVQQTKVMLSTAGPFARIGEPVVAACIRNNCDYCDITGEPTFVRVIIDKYHAQAEAKKIKIVPCCGFDCIPVDIGCSFMVNEMEKKKLIPKELKTVLWKSAGGASGGTINSIAGVLGNSSLRELRQLLSPYYLMPRGSSGEHIEPPSKNVRKASADKVWFSYEPTLKKYIAPFFMQSIDTRIVNRSNAIGGQSEDSWKYGKDFIYSEGMAVSNLFLAAAITLATHIFALLMYGTLTRSLLSLFLPQSGDGPNKKSREEGYFYFKSVAKGLDPETGNIHTITGLFSAPNGDGGYKQTSAMVSQAAISLALDQNTDRYGVLTPSTAFDLQAFMNRLKKSPGISFDVEK